MDSQRLLERFLRYVRIDTMADDSSGKTPSSPGQLNLGRMLVEELQALGIGDARQDEFGVILATISPTVAGRVPAVAFCSHLDTSPETSGANVRPQVIRQYAGGDIVLGGDPGRVIRVSENIELNDLIGQTIITTDGTTLLGADDKAGVAAIMEATQWLVEHPELRHGPVRLCFTCDEEIGQGVDHLTLGRVAAAVCYTLDGQGAGQIDVETFSANLAIVTVRGVNIHPSIGKGRMVNAVRVAAHFLDLLPRDQLSPETTESRQGFLHPYQLQGGVAEVEIRVLLRDFKTTELPRHADRLRQAAAATVEAFPGARIEIAQREQYRNMADGLAREPRAVAFAQEALRRLGREVELAIVRGGTDGSRLTELGLPSPNLSTGQHSPHSPLEWACLEEMELAAQWIVAICGVWADKEESVNGGGLC